MRTLVTSCMLLTHTMISQDREEDSVGTADGRLELHDPILQKQLL